MFTANTMSSIGEALGMSIPGRAPPAVDNRRHDAYAAGGRRRDVAERHHAARSTHGGVRERHCHHQRLGGSTNAVLHLLAIAHEAKVALTLDDFNRIAARCRTSPT